MIVRDIFTASYSNRDLKVKYSVENKRINENPLAINTGGHTKNLQRESGVCIILEKFFLLHSVVKKTLGHEKGCRNTNSGWIGKRISILTIHFSHLLSDMFP